MATRNFLIGHNLYSAIRGQTVTRHLLCHHRFGISQYSIKKMIYTFQYNPLVRGGYDSRKVFYNKGLRKRHYIDKTLL